MKSIKWKLIAMYLALVFLVMILASTFIIVNLYTEEEKQIKVELKEFSEQLEQEVLSEDELSQERYEKKLLSMKNIYKYKNFEAAILDEHAAVIASTSKGRFSDRSITEALLGKAAYNNNKMENNASGFFVQWISYTTPIIIENQVVKLIHVRTEARQMNQNIRRTTNTLVLTTCMALLFTMAAGYFFASTLTEPIRELTKKTKEFSVGLEDIEIPIYSEDEIGQLSESFMQMSRKLKLFLSQISNEKNKLEIILNNMTDGVLAFDKNKRLIHQNPSSVRLIGVIHSLTYEEFLIQYQIFEEDPDNERLIAQNGLYIHVDIAKYTDEQDQLEGIVVVLQDITEEKKLDDMRKEFVANVSHELRTPLTTVKSYTETLLDDDSHSPDLFKKFLSIINSETDHMTTLVSDLLLLSRFDNKQFKLHKKFISISEFLTTCCMQNEMLAKQQDQLLTCDFIATNHLIYADWDRLMQVCNNIITNAIKYSGPSARISISVTENQQFDGIVIQDNGKGIPKEDLPRIFERFYRVDKARSRQMGGTGLGLAIAKEIMQLHGGDLEIFSDETGTMVKISIPKPHLSYDR